MAQRVTAMDIRAATAYVGQVVNVSQFCREQQISRETFYKWRARFLAEGIDGLSERSRRPKSCPGQTPAAVEEMVLHQRRRLLELGLDHGPQSIVWALQRQGVSTPSPSTTWRILTRHGLIVPQPHKRPKSATKRFCFTRPNDCWQSDWTSWHLADGTPVAIAGTLDDHSRYLTGLQAGLSDASAALVWAVMLAAISECGIPAMSLTDNGTVYTGRTRRFEVDFEANLRALGTRTINSTPRHPQTCGKIERFWQTLKKWLRAQPDPTTLTELNTQLATFRQLYNQHRPHRALKGATPAHAFAATTPARPADHPLPGPVFVDYHRVVEDSGVIYIPPYRVNVGRRWGGHWCHSIRDGDHIVIISGTTLVRDFTADPTRYYQRSDKTTHTYRNREPHPAP